MNPDDRLALGREGEERAAAYLAGRGYRILARNVRAGGVEMDIIAARGATLVFVEVKTRRSLRYGGPEESVDPRKRARLVRGARAWLQEQRPRARNVRFDVIAWHVDGNQAWRLQHFEHAFDAGD
jgi:putative endonuclease